MEDMHIHLKNGIHSQEIFNQYIEKCILMKLKKVVFLDHGNRISQKHTPVLNLTDTIDMFNKKIYEFNQTDKANEIHLIRGIEIDYSPSLDFRKETKKILDYGNFEWIICGIHSIKFNTLQEYLYAVIDMLNNYSINAIAHLKLDESYTKYEYLLVNILKLCSSKNVYIEINTSDRSRWNDEQLFYMLNLMKQYKVNYIFSSDAHEVEKIGYMIQETMEKVKVWKMKS